MQPQRRSASRGKDPVSTRSVGTRNINLSRFKKLRAILVETGALGLLSVGVFIQVPFVLVRPDADILNCTLGFGGVGAEVREVVANRNVIRMSGRISMLSQCTPTNSGKRVLRIFAPRSSGFLQLRLDIGRIRLLTGFLKSDY